jgi:hypothetical protein
MCAVSGAASQDWSAPDAPSGGASAGTIARDTPDAAGGALLVSSGSSGGVAVARGDASPQQEPVTSLGGDQPLARVAPVSPVAVLDGAFDLLRFRFGRLVGLASVVYLPLVLAQLGVVLSQRSSSATRPGSAPSQFQVLSSSQGSSGWNLIFVLLGSCALAWLGIAVGAQVAAWVDDTDLTFGRVLRYAAGRWWVALVLAVVTWCIKVPALCAFGIGWLFADAFVFIAAIVAGAERLGPFAAIRRSCSLTRRWYWRALAVVAGGAFITLVFQLVVLAGPALLLSALGLPEDWVLIAQQLGSLLVLVTAPLTACIAARAWVDFRCRSDGTDLDRRMDDRGLV